MTKVLGGQVIAAPKCKLSWEGRTDGKQARHPEQALIAHVWWRGLDVLRMEAPPSGRHDWRGGPGVHAGHWGCC